MVHPKKYLQVAQRPGGVRGASRLLVEALRNAAHRRMRHALHGDDVAE